MNVRGGVQHYISRWFDRVRGYHREESVSLLRQRLLHHQQLLGATTVRRRWMHNLDSSSSLRNDGTLWLSGTSALVTGGASGLGAATAQALARVGARVWVIDLEEELPAYLSDNNDNNTSSIAYCGGVDITQPEQIATVLDQICGDETDHGPLTSVVHCAGMAPAQRLLSKKTGQPHAVEPFVQALNVNVVGTFHMLRLAAERMQHNPASSEEDTDSSTTTMPLRGCIVLTSSIAATDGQIGQVAYSATKAAVQGMTLPAARELAACGIRVVSIAPGLFATPLLAGLPPAVQTELGQMVPCPNRLGHPDEFAQAVLSVLSNPMFNGSVLRLDGGLRMPP